MRFQRDVALLSTLGILAINIPTPNTDIGKPEVPGTITASSKERLTTPAPSSDLRTVVAGQNDFAFTLHRELSKTNSENLFFSPYSIATALSMTYSGAKNDTALAFEKTLNIAIPKTAYHRVMNDLDSQLTSRGQGAKAADGKAFRLTTANRTFAQEGLEIEVPFLDTLAQEYGSSVSLLDFIAQTEPSRVAINSWVKQKTENKIVELLKRGIVNRDTRLVLVNAIYFNAAWSVPFNKDLTRDADFHHFNGSQTKVPTMRNSELRTRAATVNGIEVVELPYEGNELSMLVMMPPAGSLESFENSLTQATLNSYVQALQSETLDLSVPKFTTKVDSVVSAALKKMGLEIAFSDDADFSGITKELALQISDVVHSAFVNVDEAGTEAAAATAVLFSEDLDPSVRQLEINRPFLFAIYDNATGAVVFLGRIVNPTWFRGACGFWPSVPRKWNSEDEKTDRRRHGWLHPACVIVQPERVEGCLTGASERPAFDGRPWHLRATAFIERQGDRAGRNRRPGRNGPDRRGREK